MDYDADMIFDVLDYGCYLYDRMVETGEVDFEEWWLCMEEDWEDLKLMYEEAE